MSVYGENARGLHAVKVFSQRSGFTLDSLIAASYDSELTAFETLLPPLFAAYDALPADSSKYSDALNSALNAAKKACEQVMVSSRQISGSALVLAGRAQASDAKEAA